MRDDPELRLVDHDPRLAPGVAAERLARHPVRSSVDVFDVRRGVRAAAASLGFGRIVIEELAIVASELCTNIVKYGDRGELAIEVLRREGAVVALALAATDVGRPFTDFVRATRDRSDQRGTIPPEAMYGRAGIGGGLAAVRRLSSAIYVDQRDGEKTIVVTRNMIRTAR